MENKPQRPNNYLALAIISTILCCIPTGIASIIFSTQVNSAYDSGDYEKAEKASRNAKTWGIVSIVVGAIVYIASFALGIFGAIAGSSGF